MNLRTLATLADENVTTLRCRFTGLRRKMVGSSELRPEILYTFKCLFSLANSLVTGDHVVVETQHGLGVVEVLEVHTEAELDLDDDAIEYRWAFQRVVTPHLAELKATEDVSVKALVSSRRKAARQRALELLRGALTEVPLTLDGRAV